MPEKPRWTYEDYVKLKRTRGEKPLSKDEWQRKVAPPTHRPWEPDPNPKRRPWDPKPGPRPSQK